MYHFEFLEPKRCLSGVAIGPGPAATNPGAEPDSSQVSKPQDYGSARGPTSEDYADPTVIYHPAAAPATDDPFENPFAPDPTADDPAYDDPAMEDPAYDDPSQDDPFGPNPAPQEPPFPDFDGDQPPGVYLPPIPVGPAGPAL